MKRLLIAFSILASASAFAQQPAAPDKPAPTPGVSEHRKHSPEERATRQSARMEKSLGLTSEQKTKVYNLALSRAKKTDEIKAAEEAERIKNKPQLKAVQTAFEASMKDILTPEQFIKWKEQQPRRGQHNDKKGPAPDPK
jgi:Spy/CpxP family protein refolding chaperone